MFGFKKNKMDTPEENKTKETPNEETPKEETTNVEEIPTTAEEQKKTDNVCPPCEGKGLVNDHVLCADCEGSGVL